MDTKFTVAIHILIMISESDSLLSSEKIANSVRTNSSYIRKIISKLKRNGLIERKTGKFEYCLEKSKKEIKLYDIYNAVNDKKVLNIHKNANKECPVGYYINDVLEPIIKKAEDQMMNYLKNYTLDDVINDMKIIKEK